MKCPHNLQPESCPMCSSTIVKSGTNIFPKELIGVPITTNIAGTVRVFYPGPLPFVPASPHIPIFRNIYNPLNDFFETTPTDHKLISSNPETKYLHDLYTELPKFPTSASSADPRSFFGLLLNRIILPSFSVPQIDFPWLVHTWDRSNEPNEFLVSWVQLPLTLSPPLKYYPFLIRTDLRDELNKFLATHFRLCEQILPETIRDFLTFFIIFLGKDPDISTNFLTQFLTIILTSPQNYDANNIPEFHREWLREAEALCQTMDNVACGNLTTVQKWNALYMYTAGQARQMLEKILLIPKRKENQTLFLAAEGGGTNHLGFRIHAFKKGNLNTYEPVLMGVLTTEVTVREKSGPFRLQKAEKTVREIKSTLTHEDKEIILLFLYEAIQFLKKSGRELEAIVPFTQIVGLLEQNARLLSSFLIMDIPSENVSGSGASSLPREHKFDLFVKLKNELKILFSIVNVEKIVRAEIQKEEEKEWLEIRETAVRTHIEQEETAVRTHIKKVENLRQKVLVAKHFLTVNALDEKQNIASSFTDFLAVLQARFHEGQHAIIQPQAREIEDGFKRIQYHLNELNKRIQASIKKAKTLISNDPNVKINYFATQYGTHALLNAIWIEEVIPLGATYITYLQWCTLSALLIQDFGIEADFLANYDIGKNSRRRMGEFGGTYNIITAFKHRDNFNTFQTHFESHSKKSLPIFRTFLTVYQSKIQIAHNECIKLFNDVRAHLTQLDIIKNYILFYLLRIIPPYAPAHMNQETAEIASAYVLGPFIPLPDGSFLDFIRFNPNNLYHEGSVLNLTRKQIEAYNRRIRDAQEAGFFS